jgi:hypothetical protein
MAVIQISKIQIRRGLKTSGIGIPQLSSAEFAWAIDSQELFIGNGSVAEGAPYVGNTKILTEHDNILELAASYRFASSDPSVPYSIARPLQGKLDETVSVADFGAVGDGSTDCVAAFQLAFDQLFQNTNSIYKKVLLVPNGEYLFLTDIKIPSTVIMRGETRDGAVLNIGSNNVTFITEDGKEVADFNSTNRPKNVSIENLTFLRTLGEVVITGVADSVFKNVKFKGDYVLGDTVASLSSQNAAVYWQNNLLGTRVDGVTFDSCLFESNALGVKCIQTLVAQTKVTFKDSKFFIGDVGVYINGVNAQSNNWVFDHSYFEEIAKQAFIATHGKDTLFIFCDFKNCGNGVNTAASPAYEVVSFGDSENNQLISCTSNRHQSAGITSLSTTAAVAEVSNAATAKFIDRNHTAIYLSDSYRPLAVFPAASRYIYVEYSLHLSSYTRIGKLTISIDDDLSSAAITDEYQYSTSLIAQPGGALMTNFEFNVELKDNDTDSGIETILLSYQNPLTSGATGTISYNITYGV